MSYEKLVVSLCDHIDSMVNNFRINGLPRELIPYLDNEADETNQCLIIAGAIVGASAKSLLESKQKSMAEALVSITALETERIENTEE